MKLLFLDTETTGLEVGKHGVIQISGVIEIDGEVKETFDIRCRPFPGQMVSQQALKVQDLTHERIITFQTPEEAYKKLLPIFDKYIDRYNKEDKFFLVGQNTKFDYDMLTEWFKRNGNNFLYAYIFYYLIDIVQISALFKMAGIINPENMKLKTLAKCFGIEFKAHDALEDIQATREMFHWYVKTIKLSVPILQEPSTQLYKGETP